MIKRLLSLPKNTKESFFLWGPRQTGKSSLLQEMYPDSLRIDLLKTDEFMRFTTSPSLLREEIAPYSTGQRIIIDEVQKVPALLDEVHWLIENKKAAFGLCGSSARKLRRGHANLLGGRAVRYELFGFVSEELQTEFDLVRMLNHGYLPRHYLSASPQRLLRSYVGDYLKEEIAAEGYVRNLPAFSNFLTSASLSDGEIVNFSTISRDCGVSSPVVKEYFQILVDTLLGTFLPAYVRRPKRRVIQTPKFYFFDVGVVNNLAKRGALNPGGELFGKAFENWVFHELCAHRQYSELFYDLAYWRLTSGAEVDFIINDMDYAVEAKATQNINSDHLKGLRQLLLDHPKVKRRIIVSLEKRARKTEDGIEILPYKEFSNRLWKDGLIE